MDDIDRDTGKRYYYPIIMYEVEDEEYIKEIRHISGSYKVGSHVDIIYDSENPEIANIKPSIIFIILGIVFLIPGIFLISKKQTINQYFL